MTDCGPAGLVSANKKQSELAACLDCSYGTILIHVNYNLLDESWIPLLFHTGEWRLCSVKEAFSEAPEVRQIATSNPMDRVAIFRFLLTLLYWCEGSPPEENNRRYDLARLLDTLEKRRACFNLLGDSRRFMQFKVEGSSNSPVKKLLHEIPTGSNFRHFRKSDDKKDAVCLNCCVLGLLRLPMFRDADGRGYSPSINGPPPLYVYPVGRSLYENLLLNWRPHDSLGIPVWDGAFTVKEFERKQTVPLLTGLTLPARNVWLDDPEQSGRCVSCGIAGSGNVPLVKQCRYGNFMGRLHEKSWCDPHVLIHKERAIQATDPVSQHPFRMDKEPYRFIRSIADKWGAGKFTVTGLATDKAKNADVWEQTLILPEPGDYLQNFENWKKSADRLENCMPVRPKDKEGKPQKGMKAIVGVVQPEAESHVISGIGKLMISDEAAWREGAKTYYPMMTGVAQAVVPGSTTKAVKLRKLIADIKPDITQQLEAKRKGKAKKNS